MAVRNLAIMTAAAIGLHAIVPTSSMADDDLLVSLPDELKALYGNAAQDPMPSAYDDFAMPRKPWKWCHSESFQGNPWRVAVTNELRRLVGGLIERGDVSAFEVADANGDLGQEISQIRAFVYTGCSIITSVPGSSVSLNDAIRVAHEAGIPFVTAAASVTSPNAINVGWSPWRWGQDMMASIAEDLDGKGNVLLVEGIEGAPVVAMQRAGAEAVLAEHPDLKISQSVNGDWSAQVTRSAVRQVLASNATPIDAVWTTGSDTRVIAEVFVEAGRPPPLITGAITADALAYWIENPENFRFEGGAILPGWTAETLYRVAVRLLEGQEPKLNLLLMPVPAVSGTALDAWFAPCMTARDVSVFPVPPTNPIPEVVMDSYFNEPASIGFDYSTMPGACPDR